MIYDKDFFDRRSRYDTEAFLMVVRDLDSEHFRGLCRNMDRVDGDEKYRGYLNSFIDKVIKFRHDAEYNLFVSLVKHLYPETDGVLPDAKIAKMRFICNEEDIMKYRIYLLMLMEKFVRNYYAFDENFEDYRHLFKMYK